MMARLGHAHRGRSRPARSSWASTSWRWGPPTPPEHGPALRRWLEAGHAGTMGYLERRLAERLDPARVLPGARSVVCVALNYYQGEARRFLVAAGGPLRLGPRLSRRHDAAARARSPRHLAEAAGAGSRGYVDTGPVLERDLAARAGLGWIGKNTMLLNPALGSWFFIGVLLTTAELDHDEPLAGPLRHLPRLPRRLPDRRLRRALRARRAPLHLLPDHRAPRRHRPRRSRRRWPAGSSAATSARTSARGTARRRSPASRPSEPPAPYPGRRRRVRHGRRDAPARFAGTPLLRAKPAGLRRNAMIYLENEA